MDAFWPTMTIYTASTRAQYASMVRFHAGRARHRSRYDAIPGYGAINPSSLMPESTCAIRMSATVKPFVATGSEKSVGPEPQRTSATVQIISPGGE